MDLECNSWFFAAVILGVEYGLKEYFELLPISILKKKISYWIYRLSQWLILTVLLGFFFASPYPWFIWPITALGASLTGTLEHLAYCIENMFQKIIQRKIYLFQISLLIINGWLAFNTAMLIHCRSGEKFMQFLNWFSLHYGKAGSVTNAKILAVGTAVILLAYPANYIIRWLIGKSNDQTLLELINSGSPKKKNKKVPIIAENVSDNQKSNSPSLETIRAGRIIGILERWIIMILMLTGQLTGIGFVLTAKSIARFNNFNEDHFAEYYLMGTLYSVVFAIGLSLILINMR
jgi:hypothetical protein